MFLFTFPLLNFESIDLYVGIKNNGRNNSKRKTLVAAVAFAVHKVEYREKKQ